MYAINSNLGFNGAGNGDRTRDPQLGRLMLCQLSYSRIVFYLHRSKTAIKVPLSATIRIDQIRSTFHNSGTRSYDLASTLALG